MKDAHGREINYLRISLTDRCNFRCIYCMPEQGIVPKKQEDILSYEEIIEIVRATVDLGIDRIRLTGGEPLVRKGVVDFVKSLRSVAGIKEVSMTTNGSLLAPVAGELARAGLDRVNISLDTFNPETFFKITGAEGKLGNVLEGIEAALEAGLQPVKINVVIIRGINDDWEELLKILATYPIWLRFIEFMPLGGYWEQQQYVSREEMQKQLSKLGRLKPVPFPGGSGPAQYYQIEGDKGLVGFISPISQHFCGQCNRIRLTAEGKLRLCLFSEEETDLRDLLRSERFNFENLKKIIENTILKKPEQSVLADRKIGNRYMVQIGG